MADPIDPLEMLFTELGQAAVWGQGGFGTIMEAFLQNFAVFGNTDLPLFLSKLETFISQSNAQAADVNASAINAAGAESVAMAAANFKGDWTNLSGSLSGPAATRHNNKYWAIGEGTTLDNVALYEPGVASEWGEIPKGGIDGATTTSGSSDIILAVDSDPVQSISFSEEGHKITLDATGMETGLRFILINTGDVPGGITDTSGSLINTVPKKSVLYCYLTNTSGDGTWEFDPVPKTPLYSLGVTAVTTSSAIYVAHVHLDDAELVLYRGGSNRPNVVAVDPDDGTILDGPIELEQVTCTRMAGKKLSTMEGFFLYDDGTNNLLKAFVAGYSGGTLSVEGGPTDVGDGNNPNFFDGAVLDTGTIGVALNDTTNNDLRVSIWGWNGSSFSPDAAYWQLDAEAHYHISCIGADSSNFLVFGNDNTNNRMTAYSVNYDGVATISKNDQDTEGRESGGTVQPAYLEDDDTYCYFAGAVMDLVNANSEATIYVIRYTKTGGALSIRKTLTSMTDGSYSDVGFNSAVYMSGLLQLVLPYLRSDEVYSSDLVAAVFDWNSSDKTFEKVGEYLMTENLCKSLCSTVAGSTFFTTVCYDNSNNNFASIIKTEMAS